ncbi:MAG TPA: hypothetical protein VGB35_12050, partial [Gammaproteobacteria bacterium]
DPAEYGIAHREHHPCVSPDESARIVAVTLEGRGEEHLDSVIYNAGVRLFLAGRAADIGEGIARAREALASGAAAGKLAELRH